MKKKFKKHFTKAEAREFVDNRKNYSDSEFAEQMATLDAESVKLVLDYFCDALDKLFASLDKDRDKAIEPYNKYIDLALEQLRRADLTPEERSHYEARFIEFAKMIAEVCEKNSERKERIFWGGCLLFAGCVACVVTRGRVKPTAFM